MVYFSSLHNFVMFKDICKCCLLPLNLYYHYIIVIMCLQALQDKEGQLGVLRTQLEESAREMEERADELEMLKNDATSGAGTTKDAPFKI